MHHTWIAANIATKIDGYFGWISWLWASSSPLPWCNSRSQMHFQSKNKWHRKTNEAIHSRPERRRRRLLRRRRRIISGAAKLPCTTSIADHDAPPKGTTSNHQVWYSPGLLGMSAGRLWHVAALARLLPTDRTLHRAEAAVLSAASAEAPWPDMLPACNLPSHPLTVH